jgi:hypothetical protein
MIGHISEEKQETGNRKRANVQSAAATGATGNEQCPERGGNLNSGYPKCPESMRGICLQFEDASCRLPVSCFCWACKSVIALAATTLRAQRPDVMNHKRRQDAEFRKVVVIQRGGFTVRGCDGKSATV